MKIREKLKDSPELLTRLEVIEKKIKENILPFVNLPDFPDHGVKHSQIIEDLLSELAPQKMVEPLTPGEVFCVLLASLLHDTGYFMKRVFDESAAEIASDHFQRSREFVLKNKEVLGLSQHEAAVIGEICRAHGMVNLDYLEPLNSATVSLAPHGKIRLSLLSALLRVADILEITSDRASEIIFKNRIISPISREYWELHDCISNVEINTEPSWDIIITAIPKEIHQQPKLHRLVNIINDEIRTVSPVLRAAGIYFKQAEMNISPLALKESQRIIKNPFLLRLAPFGYKEANRFAGRDKEISEVIERVMGRKLIIIIGESGVGKTSLVEAGVVPRLKNCNFETIHFLFQKNPLKNLIDAVKAFLKKEMESKDISFDFRANKDPLIMIEEAFQSSKIFNKLLIVGDHLEQMFTTDLTEKEKIKFIKGFCRILGNLSPRYVNFLFCIRQDYLTHLYDLSRDIPELYERNNTFKLHRLSRENGKQVFLKASECARIKLSEPLIEDILDDLCELGEGMVYPPYFQIVGYHLYEAVNKSPNEYEFVPRELYTNLGSAETIINRYFNGLLDSYSQEDKPIIGQILQMMITDYFTKKRVTKEFIQSHIPNCVNLEELLTRLINQRIIRRSFDEYELMADSLADKLVELIRKQTFLSRPVREALECIEKNYYNMDLTVEKIAKFAGVSRTHLAVLFRDQLNKKTINNKLNEVRIAAAMKSLGSNRDPLSEIAKTTGFRSLSSFSRKFKAIVGQSPLQYRQQIINSTQLQPL